MELYEIYLGLLQGGGAALLISALWAGAGLLLLFLVGLWFPLCLAGGSSRFEAGVGPTSVGSPLNWVRLLPLALAGGLATATTAWTLSLFAFDGFALGNFIVYGACLLGAGLVWKRRDEMTGGISHPQAWLFASLFALALGLWHHAATELPILHDVPRLVFSDLHRDLGAHVQMAGLVREGGLPMQSFWGALDHDYWALSHTGHLVLIAGISQFLGIGLYPAASLLWIDAIVLIAWGVLALLKGSGLGGSARFMLVVATLVWGALAFPELHRLHDPLRESAGGGFELDAPGYWIAGRGFWNLPQTLSLSLTLVGLLVLEAFGVARQGRRGGGVLLAAAIFLLVVGGWTKPSLVIFFGPALLLWLALNRAQPRELFLAVGALSAGAFVYAIPALFFFLPPAPAWTLLPTAEQSAMVGTFMLMASPGLLVLAMTPAVGLVRERGLLSDFRVLDLALVAAGGSLLFGLLFREDQFVGFRVFQPNIWWGMSACLLLLVPLLGRAALADLKRPGWRRAVAGAGLGLSLLHVFNGFCLGVVYPTLNLRAHSASDAEVLAAGRMKTEPGMRFAVDPVFQDYDLLGYLSRPVIMPGVVGSDSEREILAAWQAFVASGEPPPKLFGKRFDALILHRDRRQSAAYLLSRGWQREALGDEFVLWQQ